MGVADASSDTELEVEEDKVEMLVVLELRDKASPILKARFLCVIEAASR
jgi:hypothetical protein